MTLLELFWYYEINYPSVSTCVLEKSKCHGVLDLQSLEGVGQQSCHYWPEFPAQTQQCSGALFWRRNQRPVHHCAGCFHHTPSHRHCSKIDIDMMVYSLSCGMNLWYTALCMVWNSSDSSTERIVTQQDLRFSQQCFWGLRSSGLW